MLGAIAITIVLQLILIYWAPARQLFHLEALPLRDLLICIAVGLSVVILVEIWKVFARFRARDEA